MKYQISIQADTLEGVGQQAQELATKLLGASAPTTNESAPKAAPAAPAAAPAPKAAPAAAPAPKAAPAAAPAPKAAPAKPGPKPKAAPTESTEVTLEDLRALGRNVVSKGKGADLRAMCAEFGSDSLTNLDASHYTEAKTKLQAMLEEQVPSSDNDGL